MAGGNKTSREERRRKALETWVNNPLMSYEQIAEAAGISFTTFYRYRQDEEFMADYKKECQKRFNALEAKAVKLMEKQMDDGNWQAVKYCLDATGYKPEEKIKANVEAATTINLTINEDL